MVYSISKHIFWPIIRLFTKQISGIENIPKPPFIIAANHQSYIDPVALLFLCAYYRNIKLYTFATDVKFTDPIWNILFDHFGAIRVGGSTAKGLEKLNEGQALAIFPEGERTYNGEMKQTTHYGLGVLAINSKVPIVPVGIWTYNFWNRHNKLPNFKKNIRITIGKPINFKLAKTQANYKKATLAAMKEVKRLARISHT
jgi:long-chain acyl-CoA synthetase